MEEFKVSGHITFTHWDKKIPEFCTYLYIKKHIKQSLVYCVENSIKNSHVAKSPTRHLSPSLYSTLDEAWE